MLDGAVEWLVAQGRTGQWGDRPWSATERARNRITGLLTDCDAWQAEVDDVPAGFVVLGERARYAPPVDEPETYVQLLVTSRAHQGQGIGTVLLDHARAIARANGHALLRVDCYRGGDRKLVGYYVSAGFTPSAEIVVGDWPGQVLEQRLT